MQSISARHSYTSRMARVAAPDSTTAKAGSESAGDTGGAGDGGDIGDIEGHGGLVLAVDAGSPVVSVAIGVGGEVLAARAVALQRSSTQLLALVAEVLEETAARPADLAGVVALAGPGSFTGLRVGLATALGLVQGLGVPALALPALAVLAAASGAPPGALVIAAVDALRGEWSAQAFRAGPVPEPAGELLRRLVPAAANREGVPETPPTSEAPDIPETPKTPGAQEIQETPKTSEAPKIPETLKTSEARETQGTPKTPGAQETQETSKTSEAPKIPETLKTSEAQETRKAPKTPEPREAQEAQETAEPSEAPETAETAEIIAFGVSALACGSDAAGGRARFLEAPPLAPAALRLAAAMPKASWRAAGLAAPIYSRPPAVTLPKPRS
jgi:tRNA threonylcarbamoyl adenosine modification protein YeaZ